VLTFIGRKWENVSSELASNKVDFESKITFPSGKMTAYGDLRIARVSQVGGKLKFVLLHDRFNR